MRDNGPKRTAKIFVKRLNLNSIKELQAESENNVWNNLQHAWTHIAPETTEKLIRWIPEFIKEIMKKRGGYVDKQEI